MIEQLPELRPSLIRITMHPGRQRAELETLSDSGFEFPSTNYRRVNGSDYRFVWGAADGPHLDGDYASSIVKVDIPSRDPAGFHGSFIRYRDAQY
jgi:beta,beta-carotene 9',10'-dioxygenase